MALHVGLNDVRSGVVEVIPQHDIFRYVPILLSRDTSGVRVLVALTSRGNIKRSLNYEPAYVKAKAYSS